MDAVGGERVALITVAREWTRIGCIGFGGPPTHIALLRRLCVEDRRWLSASEFEDGLAATNLLPGPASTQLAIFCAWRLRGRIGAMVGGVCFIVPGLIIILALAVLFLASHPPAWILGAARGAGAAVPALALNAAVGLIPASLTRVGSAPSGRARWVLYALAGGLVASTDGAYLVIVLAACGLVEVAVQAWGVGGAGSGPSSSVAGPALAAAGTAVGGLAALGWVAFKVGALSFGGGFVIIPLMQHDAVNAYHWMTGAQFLNAVALGQITPGPVVQTVAVVGYAAAGVGGGILASVIAFAPSFAFVIVGGPSFGRLRASRPVQTFLTGAGPAAIGAIAGAAIPLARAISEWWQLGVLGLAAAWLLGLRRGVVTTLIGAGALGVFAGLVGAPVG
ncbi:MAG TPA: chromate efflux transporter [Acidimicrobiales bacterium]|nr:chromate efflux transporter [Acidimicrobiales bacterium]